MARSTTLTLTVTVTRTRARSVPVAMVAAAARVIDRQAVSFPGVDGIDDLGDRSLGWNEHVDPGLAQSGGGLSADSRTHDGIDGMSLEQLNVVTRPVVVVAFRIAQDLQASAFDIREDEERRVTEVHRGFRLEPPVIVRRYTDLHGGLLAR